MDCGELHLRYGHWVFPSHRATVTICAIAKFHADGTPMQSPCLAQTYDAMCTPCERTSTATSSSARYIQTGATVRGYHGHQCDGEVHHQAGPPTGTLYGSISLPGNQKTGLARIGRSIYYTYDGNRIGKLDAGGNLVWTAWCPPPERATSTSTTWSPRPRVTGGVTPSVPSWGRDPVAKEAINLA